MRPLRPFLVTLAGLVPLLSLVAACGGGGEVADEPSVGDPVVVGSAEFTPYNVSVAATPAGGTVAVAWNDYDDVAAEEHPYVAVSTDALASFPDPLPVDPSSPYVAYPQLAMDEEGDTLIATTNYDADDGDGRPALYAAAETEVVPVVDLADATPRVAFGEAGTTIATSADGDQVLMAWLAPSADGVSPGPLAAVVSDDAGQTFGDVQIVTEHATPTRIRAFATDDQVGVAFIDAVPLDDPPAPTPAQPNPVTSTPYASVALVDDDGRFQAPIPATTGEEPVAAVGPGAGGDADGVLLAWAAPAEDGTTRILAATEADGAFADPVAVTTTDTPPVAIEAAVDGDGSDWVAVVTEEGLGLYRISDGQVLAVAVDAMPDLTAEMVDVAPLDEGGVVLATIESGDVVVRPVES